MLKNSCVVKKILFSWHAYHEFNLYAGKLLHHNENSRFVACLYHGKRNLISRNAGKLLCRKNNYRFVACLVENSI
jgi:hypothetical protein